MMISGRMTRGRTSRIDETAREAIPPAGLAVLVRGRVRGRRWEGLLSVGVSVGHSSVGRGACWMRAASRPEMGAVRARAMCVPVMGDPFRRVGVMLPFCLTRDPARFCALNGRIGGGDAA